MNTIRQEKIELLKIHLANILAHQAILKVRMNSVQKAIPPIIEKVQKINKALLENSCDNCIDKMGLNYIRKELNRSIAMLHDRFDTYSVKHKVLSDQVDDIRQQLKQVEQNDG